MDALNLANYVAIAVFDIGILFLYYFFEWYQAKYGDNKSQVTAKEEETDKQIVRQLSYDCEDARNTKPSA